MMSDEKKNPRVIITGGANGIGAHLCLKLSAKSFDIGIIDIDTEGTTLISENLKNQNRTVYSSIVDLNKVSGINSAVDYLAEKLGGIDLLVNCAAVSRKKDNIGKVLTDDLQSNFDIGITAPSILIERCKNHLKNSGFGSIVNISSIVGNQVAYDQCSLGYHLAKAGIIHLTRWMAAHLAELNIRVNCIAPGLVDREKGTKLSDDAINKNLINLSVPLKKAGNASDIADLVVFLGSEQASYINGQTITIDGGLSINECFGVALRTSHMRKNFETEGST